MDKKVFLQKNLPKRNRPYLKVLLLAAVCLILLVIATPYLVGRKVKEEAVRKPIPEKGMVVKEMPRPPEPAKSLAPAVPEDLAASARMGVSPEPAPAVEPAPAAPPAPAAAPAPPAPAAPTGSQAPAAPAAEEARPPLPGLKPVDISGLSNTKPGSETPGQAKEAAPGGAPAGGPPQSVRDLVMGTKPSAPPRDQAGAPPLSMGAASDALANRKPEPASPTVVKKGKKAGANEMSAAFGPPDSVEGLPKSPTAKGRQLFAVQVGSFKEKRNAEDMQRALQNKGYEVSLKATTHPTMGQLYIVELKPVEDMGKAHTMLEQIKMEQKVKPIIIKVQPGE